MELWIEEAISSNRYQPERSLEGTLHPLPCLRRSGYAQVGVKGGEKILSLPLPTGRQAGGRDT